MQGPLAFLREQSTFRLKRGFARILYIPTRVRVLPIPSKHETLWPSGAEPKEPLHIQVVAIEPPFAVLNTA
jgi:hypothetical protein